MIKYNNDGCPIRSPTTNEATIFILGCRRLITTVKYQLLQNINDKRLVALYDDDLSNDHSKAVAENRGKFLKSSRSILDYRAWRL